MKPSERCPTCNGTKRVLEYLPRCPNSWHSTPAPQAQETDKVIANTVYNHPKQTVRVERTPAPSAEPIRCLKTGNPCGTDTWEVNHPCQCENCQKWMQASAELVSAERWIRAKNKATGSLEKSELDVQSVVVGGCEPEEQRLMRLGRIAEAYAAQVTESLRAENERLRRALEGQNG